MAILFAAGTAFAVTCCFTRLFLQPQSFFHILDYPNERSLHACPIPRSGGVAVLAGMLAGVTVLSIVMPLAPVSVMALGLIPLVVMSFWDDRASVNPAIRLLTHGLAALLLLKAGYGIVWPEQDPSADGTYQGLINLMTILFVIWMINLYNFMDGMDGLAGGMTVVGFSCYGILGLLAGDPVFASFGFLIAGAASGFLVYNFPPAKIFLGDTGSTAFGYCAAALGLWGHRDGVLKLWVAVLIFAPFIVDATVTLIYRLFRGEKVWQAHQSHYYQKLIQIGWKQRNVLWAEYLLMFASSAIALCIVNWSVEVQISVAGAWLITCVLLMFSVSRAVPRIP
ncbi:MAG: glycosyltransferase family 4 protein [Candidatus Competibacteraceae bacterium]